VVKQIERKAKGQTSRCANGRAQIKTATSQKNAGVWNNFCKECSHDLNYTKVIFFDEAHKLYAIGCCFSSKYLITFSSPTLIKSTDTIKYLLESVLVLTKQDRLCHVIHATSDPFYSTWLRQLNLMQHCRVSSIRKFTSYLPSD